MYFEKEIFLKSKCYSLSLLTRDFENNCDFFFFLGNENFSRSTLYPDN